MNGAVVSFGRKWARLSRCRYPGRLSCAAQHHHRSASLFIWLESATLVGTPPSSWLALIHLHPDSSSQRIAFFPSSRQPAQPAQTTHAAKLNPASPAAPQSSPNRPNRGSATSGESRVQRPSQPPRWVPFFSSRMARSSSAHSSPTVSFAARFCFLLTYLLLGLGNARLHPAMPSRPEDDSTTWVDPATPQRAVPPTTPIRSPGSTQSVIAWRDGVSLPIQHPTKRLARPLAGSIPARRHSAPSSIAPPKPAALTSITPYKP